MNPKGCLLLMAATVSAQPASSDETLPVEPPEEIVVYGKAVAALRNERYRVEERVFAIFNSLNSDDEYDIHCGYRAAANSLLIRERVCEANFVKDAASAEALAFMMRRPSVPAWAMLRRKNKLLLEEMKTLAVKHPELMEALAEIGDLRDRTEILKADRRAAKGE